MDNWMRPGDHEEVLFSKWDIRDAIRNQQASLKKLVEEQTEDYVLKVSPEQFAEFAYDKLCINQPKLLEPTVDDRAVKMEVGNDHISQVLYGTTKPLNIDAQEIRVCIPFQGDEEMFYVRPVTFTLSPPHARVTKGEIQFAFQAQRIDPETLKKEIAKRIDEINSALQQQKNEVDAFNDQLKPTVLKLLASRKEAILKRKNMAASLGFAPKQREQPLTYTVPTVKKKAPLAKPAVNAKPFSPEPELAISVYEHIIEIICSMAEQMERHPETFSNLDEESLRTMFLFQLNGHYEGSATGETFNGAGKTDILVRAENGIVFVGECKIWKGGKQFKEAIDQLLGYVTWRDTKTALLVFCKNKDCSVVQSQIPALVIEHPNCIRQLEYKSEMGWRFAMANRNDAAKEFLMTVLFFCVPCE